MEKYLFLFEGLVVTIFVVGCLAYTVRHIAAQDLKYFCNHQIDRFPIESVYCLTKKDVETFRFMFMARLNTGNDREAIHQAIVRLKGPRGDILKQAYDLVVNK